MEIKYELTIDDAMAFVRFRRGKSFLFHPLAFLIPPALGLLFRFWSPSTVTQYGFKGEVTTWIGNFWAEFIPTTVIFTCILIWICLLYTSDAADE